MFKQLIENTKAVAFDLDGTLVNTQPLWIQAKQKVCDGIGLGDVNAADFFVPGLFIRNQWESVLENHSQETQLSIEELVQRTYKNFIDIVKETDIDVTDGFWELTHELKQEKGLKLALVTNTVKFVAEILLEKLGASKTFDVYVFGDEVRRKKPHPEIYKEAAKRLDVKPKEILSFEDSVAGAISASKAGANVIVIWDTQTPRGAYKGNIIMFTPDFTGFPGNLDKNFRELWDENMEGLRAKLKTKP